MKRRSAEEDLEEKSESVLFCGCRVCALARSRRRDTACTRVVTATDTHPHEGNVASLPRGSGATVSLLPVPRFPHQPPISRRRSALLNLLPTHGSAGLPAYYVLVQWLPLT